MLPSQKEFEDTDTRVPLTFFSKTLTLLDAKYDFDMVPDSFKRIFGYILSSAPPGQMLMVMAAGIEAAILSVAHTLSQQYIEARFCVFPLTSKLLRLIEPDEKHQQRDFSAQECFAVLCEGNRVRLPDFRMLPWYILYEKQCLVQIDPQAYSLVDVHPLSSSVWKMLRQSASCGVFSNEVRDQLDTQLRLDYVPNHYVASKSCVGLSVHLADSNGCCPLALNTEGKFELNSNGAFLADALSSKRLSFEEDEEDRPHSSLNAKKAACWDIQVVISVANYDNSNFWGGDWSSVWNIFLVFDAEKKEEQPLGNARSPNAIHLEGEIRVQLHYSEDGCAFSQHSRRIDVDFPVLLSNEKELARCIIQHIKRVEQEEHNTIATFYAELHAKRLRSVRRLFPLGGSKFDWSCMSQTMAEDVALYNLKRLCDSKTLQDG